MKHKGKFFSALTLSTALLLVTPMVAQAATYLETDKNYYQDTTVTKGFLDKVISDGTDGNEKTTDTDLLASLKVAAAQGLVVYKEGMTYNEYFLANNISPEDNFTTVNGVKITIPNKTGLYNSHRTTMGTNPITYVGPATNEGLAYWGEKTVSNPVLFSRLTVGDLPTNATEGTLSLFNQDGYLMSNRIGYGEVATVNDYMLTQENDFIIPTRFNTSRNDVYLTMREHQFFGAGIDSPRAFLRATINGKDVESKAQNPNAYIDLTGNVYITEVGYDQLGTLSKFFVPTEFPKQSKQFIHNLGVNEFMPKMNELLSMIETYGPSQLAPIGSGGQIQLSGFYRQSTIDNEFTESVLGREKDSVTTIDVAYYMYTERTENITTPLASNGKHLLSPNETTYKLEITRPFFTQFGDLATPVVFNDATFAQDLGVNSFAVVDNGKLANGDDVTVDVSRVKVRIDAGTGFSSVEYTLDELKAELSKAEYLGKTVKVAYTYAATDAQDEIIGKLPAEIANDEGAYAVPIVRNVTIPEEVKGTLIVKYVTEQGEELTTSETSREKLGTSYTTSAKIFAGYELLRVEGSEKGNYIDGEITVTYVYRKLPVVTSKGTLTVKYVTEQGDELVATVTAQEAVGTPYETMKKEFAGYELLRVEGNEVGLFIDGEINVVYVYRKVVETPDKSDKPKLPETGVVANTLVTSLGATLLGLGAIVNRKNKEK